MMELKPTPQKVEIAAGAEWQPEGYKEGTWWGHIVDTKDGFAIIRDVTHSQAKLLAKYTRAQVMDIVETALSTSPLPESAPIGKIVFDNVK